jgi:hypothetical protein
MNATQNKIQINLFGVGCIVTKASVEDEVWKKITDCSGKLKVPIELLFFDSDFYEMLNMPKYKSWRDFNNLFEVSGLINNSKSIIEIKNSKKKIAKIKFSELINENLLFPLYNLEIGEIEKHESNKKNLTIFETEIGTVASYQFVCKKFDIDKLKFAICNLYINESSEFVILSDIFYNEVNLVSKTNDTLVTKQNVIIE